MRNWELRTLIDTFPNAVADYLLSILCGLKYLYEKTALPPLVEMLETAGADSKKITGIRGDGFSDFVEIGFCSSSEDYQVAFSRGARSW